MDDFWKEQTASKAEGGGCSLIKKKLTQNN
jgi:hypothetical protein